VDLDSSKLEGGDLIDRQGRRRHCRAASEHERETAEEHTKIRGGNGLLYHGLPPNPTSGASAFRTLDSVRRKLSWIEGRVHGATITFALIGPA
jgi:hypothetical protein